MAHNEAGLRSFNRAMPEEHNRVLTDHCADLLACPTPGAVEQLAREGITDGVHLVGDVMYDAALHFEPETSAALGFGFRCGFLGMLHMEIVQERLEREYNLDLITTAPTVIYEALLANGETAFFDNPSKLPAVNEITELREPIISTNILVPNEHVGAVMKLCNDKRGAQKHMRYVGGQVSLEYEMPLAEIVLDFFDLHLATEYTIFNEHSPR